MILKSKFVIRSKNHFLNVVYLKNKIFIVKVVLKMLTNKQIII